MSLFTTIIRQVQILIVLSESFVVLLDSVIRTEIEKKRYEHRMK